MIFRARGNLLPNRRFICTACALASFLLLWAQSINAVSIRPAEGASSLFGLTNVWTIDLKVSAEDWKKMEPGPSGPAPARGRVQGNPPDRQDGPPPMRMHIDFQYVPATLEF